jgi:hypothetical protein
MKQTNESADLGIARVESGAQCIVDKASVGLSLHRILSCKQGECRVPGRRFGEKKPDGPHATKISP